MEEVQKVKGGEDKLKSDSGRRLPEGKRRGHAPCLSTDVFEPRAATGSRMFSSLARIIDNLSVTSSCKY